MENRSFTVMASEALTATKNIRLTNPGHAGIVLVVDITAESGTWVLIVAAVEENPVGYGILLQSGVLAVGKYTFVVYPDASGGDVDEVQGIALPGEYHVIIYESVAGSLTLSIRGHLVK